MDSAYRKQVVLSDRKGFGSKRVVRLKLNTMKPNPSASALLVGAWISTSILVSIAACRHAPPLSEPEAEGKHLYSVRCAHCHEENDLQLKKVPPNLRSIFSRTTLPSGAPATDSEVRRVVLAGRGLMPAFSGRFTDEQMKDLIAYLHTGLR